MDLTLFALQKVTAAGKSMTIADLFMPPAKVAFFDDGTGPKLTLWEVDGVTAPTEAEVAAALAAPNPPPTQAQLLAYANAKQAALRDGGMTVNVGTSSAPIVVDVASDVDGRSLVSGSVQMIGLASQSGAPAPSFQWDNDDDSTVSLNSTQMLTIGLALGVFVQATYDALGIVKAAIANGTITSVAGIDAASWPSVTA